MTINTRISELIYALRDNENSFAKRIGVSSSVIFNTVNPKGRGSYPSGPVLEKILSIDSEGKRVSAEWLMRGEGNMFLGDESLPPGDTREIYKSIEELNKSVSKLQDDFEALKKDNI